MSARRVAIALVAMALACAAAAVALRHEAGPGDAARPSAPVVPLGGGLDEEADRLAAAQNDCIARAAGAELVVRDGELMLIGDAAAIRRAWRRDCAAEAEAFAAFQATDRYRAAAAAAAAAAAG